MTDINSEIYEYPMEPKIRTLLRFHYLLKEFNHFCNDTSSFGSKHVLLVFFELIHLLERSDIKHEILKDLDKLLNISNQDNIINQNNKAEIKSCFKNLENMPGKITQKFYEIPFINSIKARFQIPGGTMKFDLPLLQVWLNQSFENRSQLLHSLQAIFSPLEEGIKIILYYMTNNQTSQNLVAENGLFQISLDPKKKFQLMLIKYSQDPKDIYYPEISGNHHLMTIRFINPSILQNKSRVVQKNINFELTFCNLLN